MSLKISKFRCLGKNKNGSRCKKTFITSSWSKILTCSTHKTQEVDFQYSSVKNSCPLHDIAFLIAKEIDDPKTFSQFAKVCLSTAKQCHKLQEKKKEQFSNTRKFYGFENKYLPNGEVFKTVEIPKYDEINLI